MKKNNWIILKKLSRLKSIFSIFFKLINRNKNNLPWYMENNKTRLKVNNKTKTDLILEVLDNEKKLKIMEIGTAGGNTTEEILTNVMRNNQSVLYAFDPFIPYPDKDLRDNDLVLNNFLNRFKSDIAENRLKFSRITSFDGLINLYKSDHKETFDLIFIDGNHAAKSVLEDFFLSLPLVKKNGYILFDDYEWYPKEKNNRSKGYKSMEEVPLERVPKYAIDLISKLENDIKYISAANNYNVLLFKKL